MCIFFLWFSLPQVSSHCTRKSRRVPRVARSAVGFCYVCFFWRFLHNQGQEWVNIYGSRKIIRPWANHIAAFRTQKAKADAVILRYILSSSPQGARKFYRAPVAFLSLFIIVLLLVYRLRFAAMFINPNIPLPFSSYIIAPPPVTISIKQGVSPFNKK